jgi:hypothetical protein
MNFDEVYNHAIKELSQSRPMLDLTEAKRAEITAQVTKAIHAIAYTTLKLSVTPGEARESLERAITNTPEQWVDYVPAQYHDEILARSARTKAIAEVSGPTYNGSSAKYARRKCTAPIGKS